MADKGSYRFTCAAIKFAPTLRRDVGRSRASWQAARERAPRSRNRELAPLRFAAASLARGKRLDHRDDGGAFTAQGCRDRLSVQPVSSDITRRDFPRRVRGYASVNFREAAAGSPLLRASAKAHRRDKLRLTLLWDKRPTQAIWNATLRNAISLFEMNIVYLIYEIIEYMRIIFPIRVYDRKEESCNIWTFKNIAALAIFLL